MRTIWKFWPALPLLIMSSLLVLAWAAGVRVNVTPSLPRGLYRLTGTAPVKGGLVTLCPPLAWVNRGYGGTGQCPGGVRPLLKRLVAMPGDVVSVEPDGIRINGVLQPYSAARLRDSHARPLLPELTSGVVPPGFAVVLAPVENSFDGRYFGLVALEELQAVDEIVTFGGQP